MSIEATNKEINDTRIKFYNVTKEMFPDVGEPGAVWVLSEVLGWSMDKIQTVTVEGFGKKSYRLFILGEDGQRLYTGEDGIDGPKARTVTREWTKEEKSKLREWWWLLGF